MKNLIKPNIDSKHTLDNIIEKKHEPAKTTLSKIKYDIYNCYDIYPTSTEELNSYANNPSGHIWPEKEANDLRNCYGKGKAYRELRLSILQDVITCPFCENNEANTLDHYFCKEKFPQYSVCADNLVPCCSSCNSNKGTLLTKDNKRLFLHFYYDKIPEYQFIFCRFTFSSDNIPYININTIFKRNELNADLIERHIHQTEYIEKTKSKITSELKVEIRNIKETKLSLADTRITYTERYKSNKIETGSNAFKTIFYEGIINSKDFIEHLYEEGHNKAK